MKIPYFRNNPMNSPDRDNNSGGSWVPLTIAICSGVILYSIINNIPALGSFVLSVLKTVKPIILGLVIAYMINPLVKLIHRGMAPAVKNERVCGWIAIAISYAVVILFMGLLLYSLIPQLFESMMQFVNNINSYAAAVNDLVNNLAATARERGIDVDTVVSASNNFLSDAVAWLTNNAGSMLGRSVSYGSDAVGVLIGFILSIYFLLSKRMLIGGIDRLMHLKLSASRCSIVKKFLKRCNDIVSRFIIDDLLDALIVGVVNFIFMTFMHMPYSVLISVVVGVTNLAPTFGPFVGAFIGGFVLLFASPGDVIAFEIFTLILQLCDGYVLKPKLFGDTLGVPGVWMVSGIIVGGELFGVIGILLAVPAVGIINFVYRDYIELLEAEQKARLQEEELERKRFEAEAAEIEKEVEAEDSSERCD